jgi:hypothetical protein
MEKLTNLNLEQLNAAISRASQAIYDDPIRAGQRLIELREQYPNLSLIDYNEMFCVPGIIEL